LFAGLALEGATLRQDLDDNATLYGKPLENRAIVTTGVRAPKAAASLLAQLNKISSREGQPVGSAVSKRTTSKK
jgi:lipid-binding SYLF domain-containing protein